MKKELDEKLCSEYPLIFADRNKPMTETAMCWGFECGDGWYHLLDNLCRLLYNDYSNAKHKYETHKQWYEDTGHFPWTGGRAITPEEVENLRLKMEEEAQKVPVASQVKEKFGGLRFYVDRATEKHYHYIEFADDMSYHICEECGSPGKLYAQGWHKTLCEKHAEELGYSDDESNPE
jgi:hypothetical protein